MGGLIDHQKLSETVPHFQLLSASGFGGKAVASATRGGNR
jgi:hypothetical protein